MHRLDACPTAEGRLRRKWGYVRRRLWVDCQDGSSTLPTSIGSFMSDKTDIRILKTKGKFRRALLDLLSVKSLNQISVCEICQKAGVNRNTFYAHYASAEDLMSEVQASFTRELVDCIRIKGEYITSVENLLEITLSFVKNNKDMCTLIFSGGGFMITDILNEIYPSVVASWRRSTGLSEADAQSLFQFISGGSVSVIKDWVISGFSEGTQTVARRLDRMILGSQERLTVSSC